MLMGVFDKLKLLDFSREIRTKSDEIEVNILYGFSANEEYLLLESAFATIFKDFYSKIFFSIPAKNVTESESNKYVTEFESEFD